MHFWKEFLDSLDSNGGHLVIAFALFLIGMALSLKGIDSGREVTNLSLGALFMAIKSNRQANGNPSTDK